MKTSEAIEIVQETITEVGGGEIHARLILLLEALEAQEGFESADKNTRSYLREVIRTCDAVFEVLANEHLSEKTKAQALADGRSLIASVKADEMI